MLFVTLFHDHAAAKLDIRATRLEHLERFHLTSRLNQGESLLNDRLAAAKSYVDIVPHTAARLSTNRLAPPSGEGASIVFSCLSLVVAVTVRRSIVNTANVGCRIPFPIL